MANDAPMRPASHADAAKKNKRGADANLSVAEAKHRASTDNAQESRSDRNLAKVRKENWNATPGPQHGR